MTTEPLGLSSPSLLWNNNFAGYGPQMATQATTLDGPESYLATVYDDSLDPPLIYSLFDYYNNSVLNDTDDVVHITIFSIECGDERAFLSGSDTLAAGLLLSQGSASFSDLQVYCAPLGNLTVEITASLILYGGVTHSVSALTNIRFRDCEIGEELKSGVCVKCPTGSFSVTQRGTCAEYIRISGQNSITSSLCASVSE